MNQKTHFSIKLIGLSETDKSNLTAILSLAETRLSARASIVDHLNADFYVLSERLITLADQDERLKTLPRQRCIFYTQNETESNCHSLKIDQNRVPSLGKLVVLFQTLLAHRAAEHSDTEPQPGNLSKEPLLPEQPEQSESSEFFNPNHRLIAQLKLNDAASPLQITLRNQAEEITVYLNHERETCAFRLDHRQMQTFFADTTTIIRTPIALDALQQAVAKDNLSIRPLADLLWCVVFTLSQGRPQQDYRPEQAVCLTRWPDVSLPNCRSLVTVAAYLKSNMADLKTVAAKTQTPIERVFDFYNACHQVGWIKTVDHTELHEKPLDPTKRALLGKISNRLRQAASSEQAL